jgi:outer membrane protein OmpA-like peptidoglycan-associated protein
MKKLYLSLLLLAAFSTAAMAQVDLTLYNMRSIHQSGYINPAAIPLNKISIGLPGISSDYFYLSNSGFAYSDLVTKRSDDSLVLDIDNAISKMGDKNFMSNAISIDLLSVGLKVKKNYFCLNITEKENFNFMYTKDFFDFIQHGNTSFLGKKADFSGMGFNGSHYREYGISMAREINEKITLGGRIKYLYGMENVSTDKSDLSLYTDAQNYDLALESGVEVNTSTLANNTDGFDDLKASDYLFKQKNSGWGLDLGGHYTLNEKLNFSLSVVDLGFIKWKSNVKNYTSNTTTYNFQGIDLNQFVGDTTENGQNVLDSLNDSFKPEETHNAYTTYLSTHIFAGANYVIRENTFAGLLLRGQFFKGSFIPSATLSINQQVGRHLSLALSYSAMNRSYNNIGFGFSTNAGPVQLYLVSDNMLGAIKPVDAQTFNVHFGINLIFGRPPRDRDHDKVPDKTDLCPEIFGLVALNGCPDKDGDGIADKDDACPDNPGPAATHGCPDRDGDGIADKDDECPDIKGLLTFNGCPDTDGDGISDIQDTCPEVAGLPQFHGCPDVDGDSIPDKDDACPTVAGLMKFDGCPDTDGDSIPDSKDDCPFVAGPVSNKGCPVIEKIEPPKEPAKVQLTKEEQEVINKVFKNLEFETGKAVIRPGSFASLDELTNLLKKKITFKLLIDGHTDNVGAKAFNQKLSQGRADAVKKYLTDKGIDASRITAKGYGMTKPVAPNTTPEGRQKNRRVEFTIME